MSGNREDQRLSALPSNQSTSCSTSPIQPSSLCYFRQLTPREATPHALPTGICQCEKLGVNRFSPWLYQCHPCIRQIPSHGSRCLIQLQEPFTKLRSNLEITFDQALTVATRQNGVRQTVNAGMKVVDDFLTGSYMRSTMISPLKEADVDIFIVLDPHYFNHYNNQNGGPAALLDYTKRLLLKTYTSTPDISRNGQAVSVRFADFVVDVVVGFNRNGGGYIIANSMNNSWLETNPKRHVEMSAEANKLHNGQFVPIIKMIKSWNKAHGSFFRSFHIEVLALEIFRGVKISDFPSGYASSLTKQEALCAHRTKTLQASATTLDATSPRQPLMTLLAASRAPTRLL